MTGKRFTCDNDYYKGLILKDNLTNEILEEDGIGGYYTACDKLNELVEENEQLKERNNRQAKQLDNLYTLIEKQDWKILKGLIQEFQECEEQLQQEWKCYE